MVAAHVESPEGVRVALENGVDTIEHGARLTDETIRLFKERGASLICTLSPALPYAEFELSESHALPIAKKNGRIVMDGMIDCAKACLEHGIPVGLGNDVAARSSCTITSGGSSVAITNTSAPPTATRCMPPRSGTPKSSGLIPRPAASKKGKLPI
jgi:imidazolonepropionase-like amidohydrolase